MKFKHFYAMFIGMYLIGIISVISIAFIWEITKNIFFGIMLLINMIFAMFIPIILNLIIKKFSNQKFILGRKIVEIQKNIEKSLITKGFYKKSYNLSDEKIDFYEKRAEFNDNIITRVLLVNLDNIKSNEMDTKNMFKKTISYLKKEIQAAEDLYNPYEHSYYSIKNFVIFLTKNKNEMIEKLVQNNNIVIRESGPGHSIIDIYKYCIICFTLVEEDNSIIFGKLKNNLLAYEKIKENILTLLNNIK